MCLWFSVVDVDVVVVLLLVIIAPGKRERESDTSKPTVSRYLQASED